MKKLKYWIGAIVLGTMALTSCEDYFEKVPSDLVEADDHYKTFIDAQISQSGVFTLLQDVTPDLVVLGELMGDLVTVTSSQDADLNELNTHNISITNSYINTSGYYRIIIAANEVLQNLKLIKERDSELNDIEYERLVGSLVALKSFCYLTLVQLHGEAAYIPGNVNDLGAIGSFEYISKDEMLDRLLIDLDTLDQSNDDEDVFLYDEESTSASNFLAQIVNINSIIGDIYLEKQIYDTAAMHFEAAFLEIGGLMWSVGTVFRNESWKELFMNYGLHSNIDEIMLSTYFSLDYNQVNPLEKVINYDRDYKLKPSQVIIDLYNSQNDNEGDEFRGLDASYGMSEEGEYYINKYALGERGSSHIIHYRSAGVLLKWAEALNLSGSKKEALSLVNQAKGFEDYFRNGIRSRVNLPPIKFPTDLASSQDSLLFVEDVIMDERAMELAFEGKRWFDLMRVANRDYRGAEYLANKVAAKFGSEANQNAVRDRLLDKNNWYLPYVK